MIFTHQFLLIMRTFSVFFLFLAALGLSSLTQSCQKTENADDVNQDRIYQYLELFYDEAKGKTFAYAQFRFGNAIGIPLELTSASGVTVDGNMMRWNDDFNVNRYEWEWTGKVSTATFSYTDGDGKTFANSLTINDIGFPITLDTISKDTSYNLVWTGAALSADENVWISLNEGGEANSAIFQQNNLGATSITLDEAGLSKIAPSPVTIWMDRVNKPAINQATSTGGILIGRYRATKTNAIVTD